MKLCRFPTLFFMLLLALMPSCKRKKVRSAYACKPISWDMQGDSAGEQPKKKVLIISSIGGGAHTAACRAIRQYVGDQYHIASVNMFSEIMRPLDPFRFFSPTYSTEHLYNDLLSRQYVFLVETYAMLGRASFRWMPGTLDELIEQFIDDNKPDVVISVIGWINGSIYRVAKKRNIPFGIIPCDLDVRNYCNDLYKPDYEKFIFGLSFDDKDIREHTKAIKVSEERTRYIGFPVRPEFLEKKGYDTAKIKKDFAIPEGKKVVMVLMGSAGSGATVRYAKTCAEMKAEDCPFPLHLILCLGKNERLRATIEAIKFPQNVSVSIIGFTDRIADLMRVSDLLITKAGPASVCEALCIGVPMIIDHTQPILWWEQMNIDFVKDHGFGDELKRIRKLPKMLKHYLSDDSELIEIRERMNTFVFPDVVNNVRQMLADLVALVEENKDTRDI